MSNLIKKILPFWGKGTEKKSFRSLPEHDSLESRFQSIISFFQFRNGVKNFPSDILTIINDYDFGSRKSTIEGLAEIIRVIPKKFNLIMKLHDLSILEIRSYVTESSPLLVILGNENGMIQDMFAIEGYSGLSYHLVDIQTSEKMKLSESKLIELFSLKNLSQKIKILSAEPTSRFLSPIKKEKKADKFFSAIRQIFFLMKLERKDIWIITIYGIGIGILSLVIPISTSSLVNVVTFGVMLQPVYVLTFIVVCFMGFAGLMQVVQTYVIEILQRRIFVRIAIEFSEKFPQMNNDTFSTKHKPELANRFFDTVTIQKSINSLLVDGLSVVLTAIIGFTLIATYHPLFLVFDVFVLFIGAYLIIYRRGVKAAYNYLDVSLEKYRVGAWIEEISRHESLFHSNIGRNFAYEKMENLMKDYLWTRERFFHNYIRQVVGLVSVQTIASGVLLGIGGYLVIERQLTIGQLVAAEIVISKVLSDMAKFGKHLEGFYSLVASVDKVTSVLDAASDETPNNLYFGQESKNVLEVHGLSYENALGKKLLEDIHFSILMNRKIALKITDVQAKDALFDILIGLIRPDSGEVLVGGQNVLNTDYFLHHNNIILLRRNELVEGDLTENIRLGDSQISHLDIIRAIDILGGSEILKSLPDGLKTSVATFGAPLNQMERSLIQLVRFVVHKPKLAIIDGLLDEIPEFMVNRFFEYANGKDSHGTVLLYSKLPTVLSKVDSVIILEDTSAKKIMEKQGKKRNV